MQQTITDISDFPNTLEEGDSFNRDLLPDVMKYLKLMFNRKDFYRITGYASNFAVDTLVHSDEYGRKIPKTYSALHGLHGGCHGAFNRNHNKGTSLFVNFFYTTLNKGPARQFLDWILNPEESPWGACLHRTTIIRDAENDFPVCLIFRDLGNEDIHLATNLLIATRLHTEFYSSEIWSTLVSLGFTPAEAMAIAPNFAVQFNFSTNSQNYVEKSIWDSEGIPCRNHEDTKRIRYKVSCGIFQTSDRPFYCDFDTSLLINKTPKMTKEKRTLKKGYSPNPCNYIWGGGESSEDADTKYLFQSAVCLLIDGRYTSKDIFGFWEGNPKKPSDDVMDNIKKVLALPKANRGKQRINLHV